MGPIAARWAEAMCARGHQVEVVTAHPHYPGALWGRRARPYRETRNGIPVLRLPLVIGHRTTAERITEEATYAAGGGGGGRLPDGPGRGGGGLSVVPRPVPGPGERSRPPLPLDPVARGHPSRRRGHHRADARRASRSGRPSSWSGSSIAPRTGSS